MVNKFFLSVVRISLFIIFLILTIPNYAQCERYLTPIFDNYNLETNILYGANIKSNKDSMNLMLDVFTPKNDTAQLRPLLIYLHGGSFVNGSKESGEAYNICKEFVKRGFVAVSPAYRQEESFLSMLSSAAMIKAVLRATEDFKAAIRYMFKTVIEDGNPYRIDTNKVIVGGASAGSIAVMHAVYVNDINELEPPMQRIARALNAGDDLEGNSGNAGYPWNVLGVINVSGALKSRHYLANETKPLLSIHNEIDITIPYKRSHPNLIPFLPLVDGSGALHPYYKSLGQESILHTVEGIGHVPYNEGGEIYDKTIEWMTSFASKLVGGCSTIEVPTPITLNTISSVKIFPNPTNGIYLNLSLQSLNLTNAHITIVNFLGQKEGEYKNIDLSSTETYQLRFREQLARGNYHLKIEENGKLYTSSFLVTH